MVLKGSNPSLSAERDCPCKKGVVSFSLPPETFASCGINSNTGFITGVRNAPLWRSYTIPSGNTNVKLQ